MARISIKAVAIGGAVDILATNLLMLPVAVSLLAGPAIAALPATRQTAAISDAMMASPSLYTTGLLLGSASSVLGGWVAARIAKRDELLHGALSAFACVFLGIYGLFINLAGVGPWEHAAFFVLTPALGALGGLIRARQQHRPAPKAALVVEVGEVPSRPILRAWERGVYVANRILLTCSAFFALFFVLIAAYSHGTGDREATTGSIVFSTAGFVVFVLYFAAGRALVAGRARHWWLHAGALSLTLLPLLFVLSLAR